MRKHSKRTTRRAIGRLVFCNARSKRKRKKGNSCWFVVFFFCCCHFTHQRKGFSRDFCPAPPPCVCVCCLSLFPYTHTHTHTHTPADYSSSTACLDSLFCLFSTLNLFVHSRRVSWPLDGRLCPPSLPSLHRTDSPTSQCVCVCVCGRVCACVGVCVCV